MSDVDLAELLDDLAHAPRLEGALCRNHADLFDAPNPRAIAAALDICAACPCLDACRAYLADTPAPLRPWGVVGGEVLRPRGSRHPDWLLAELTAATRHRPNPPQPLQPHAPRRDQAADWLTHELEQRGPARSDQLVAAAKAVGIPRHQLQRARAQLGIAAERHGTHTIWKTA